MIEGKATAPRVGLKPQLGPCEPVGYPPVKVDPNAIFHDLHILFVRLFQSQSQAGTASAKAPYKDPEPNRLRLPLQTPGDLLGGVRCNPYHLVHLRNGNRKSYTPYGTTGLGWASR